MAKYAEYRGGKCVKCGATENLHFHHRNPEEKAFDISSKASCAWKIIRPELDKCDLLCERHHGAEHHGHIGHGTHAMYQHHGCRCDLCRAANTKAQRDSRRRVQERINAGIG